MGKLSNVLKMTPPAAPARTPERQRLADAIAGYHEIERRLNAVRSVNESSLGVHELRASVAAKEEAIEEAKRAAATYLFDSAQGKNVSPPKTVKQARAELQEAEDALEAAREAAKSSEEECHRLEGSLQLHEMRIKSAVESVIATDANLAAIIAEAEAARTRLLALASVLATRPKVRGLDGFPISISVEGTRDLLRVDKPHDVLHAGQALFAEALNALFRDPDAPIPTLDELFNAQPQARPAA